MKIKFTLVHNRTKKLNKDGEALIQVKAYQATKNRYFSTKIYVKPSQWDSRRSEIKKHPNDFRFNHRLIKQINEYKSFENDFINHHGFCSLDDLGTFIKSKGLPTFTQFYQDEVDSSALEPSTKQSQLNTLSKLQKYRKTVYFRDLSYRLIDGFDGYLRRSKLSVNTIAKHHKDLKKYINLAIKKDYIEASKNPYRKFDVRKEETAPRDFLTMAEIERLRGLEFTADEEYLELIRDMFLFSCFTGLRYSDLANLSSENIIEVDRGLQLEFKAQKTKKYLILPLYSLFKMKENKPSFPEQIIRKYSDYHKRLFNNHPTYKDEPFFKGLSNQHVNRELKEIGARAALRKKLTAHIGRHTFGTNMATKVKPLVLKELMQHTKLETTMIYVHLSKQLVGHELDKIEWNND